MKIKKLEITGFKSFVDKTAIEFPIGISAIVGPNGCGKSNIVDALRWVMGEQSVKQLRGKSMEDVIFSGTNGHPPTGMAEVSLTLLNDNGSAPEELKDFSEIMLTRRLYRSGESAYFINKQPCRLKDIHNVFLGSGIGAKSYSVIQQGNVGAITEAGPEERRQFIEEAAGITRYKNRKTEALRKVEATKQNLLRVMDIISEINRQMASLKRQAKKAEVYKKLQDRIRFLEISLGRRQYDALTEEIHETSRMLTRLQDEDQQHSTKLREVDAAVEAIKLRRQEKIQEISNQKSGLHELQRTIDKVENDLAHLRSEVSVLGEEISGFETLRIEIVSKNEDMISEINFCKTEQEKFLSEIDAIKAGIQKEREASRQLRESLAALNQTLDANKSELMNLVAEEARYKNTYQNATQNIESLKRRLKKIGEEEYTASTQVTRLENSEGDAHEALQSIKTEAAELDNNTGVVRRRLEEKNAALVQKAKQLQALEKEKHEAESRFSALKKMQDSYQWYKSGVQAVMKEVSNQKNTTGRSTHGLATDHVAGLVADILEPDPAVETAVEAVLGESLQYIIIKEQQDGVAAMNFLTEGNAGRSGFVPVSSLKHLHCDSWAEPDPARLLLNHVAVKPGFEDIARGLLGHVVLVEDLTEAVDLFNRNGVHQTIVTRDGGVITQQGVMLGGSKDNLSGILEKKREVKALEKKTASLKRQIASIQAEFDELENDLRRRENELQKLLERRHQLSRDEVEAEKALYKISEDLKHANTRLEIVRLEQEQLIGEENDIQEEMKKYNHALAEIERRVKTAQDGVTQTTRSIESVSIELDAYNQKVVDLQMELTEKNAGLENSNSTLRRVTEFYEDGKKRLAQLKADMDHKLQRKSISERNIREAEPRLHELYSRMKSILEELEANETDYHTIDQELENTSELIEGIKTEREKTLHNIRLLEVENSQLEMRRENIVTRLTDRYQLEFFELSGELATAAQDYPAYAEMTSDQMSEEVSKSRNKIEKIKDVNLSAIKEYEELRVRHDFLAEQQKDLENAIDNLYKVIRKINRITQEKFLKTFHEINEKLDVVFPRLFDGGTAKLVMTDPDDPLETGVEFMIHPPGKKLTRLSLLSGGEKALSAIAFIFSIFLLKPTSFCLMDEIDAPLDDANVFRFNDLLKIIGEKSQVIMITHNKKTMEFADSLFGVTMEKKGVSKLVSVNFGHRSLPAGQTLQ